MARRTRNENDIDPFNAGEPIMPWDDSAALHDDAEECAFDDAPYRAPSKRADGYVSPETPAAEATAARARRKASDTAGRASKRGRKAARKEAAVREAARRTESDGRAQRDAARSRIRAIVFFCIFISLAASLAGGLVSCAGAALDRAGEHIDELFDAFDGNDSGDVDDAGDYAPTPQTEFTDDEAAVRDVVLARLDALGTDERWRASARAKLDSRLDDYLDYSADDLRLDADAYIDWLLAHTTWTVDAAFAFDDEGSVYVSLTAPDAYALFDDFTDDARDILGSRSGKRPSDAQRTRIAAAFIDEMDDDPDTATHSLRFTAKPGGAGTWILDEDAFYNELAYPLG